MCTTSGRAVRSDARVGRGVFSLANLRHGVFSRLPPARLEELLTGPCYCFRRFRRSAQPSPYVTRQFTQPVVCFCVRKHLRIDIPKRNTVIGLGIGTRRDVESEK